jgi:hypothetical protein
MLRSESGGDFHVTACGQRIERVREVFCDRSGMCEQSNAPAGKRRTQSGFVEKAVDAKFHSCDDSDANE